MDKQVIIALILTELTKKLEILTQAALSAHHEATHEENKAENKYDTRGLEASYLAGAQAERAAELKETITYYKFISLKKFTPQTPIAATALVELENEEKTNFYFIAPYGGGLRLSNHDKEILVIGPQAPLGAELMGRKQGEVLEIKTRTGIKEYTIISVC
jgi:transcription elongation GreA/GreB family factor